MIVLIAGAGSLGGDDAEAGGRFWKTGHSFKNRTDFWLNFVSYFKQGAVIAIGIILLIVCILRIALAAVLWQAARDVWNIRSYLHIANIGLMQKLLCNLFFPAKWTESSNLVDNYWNFVCHPYHQLYRRCGKIAGCGGLVWDLVGPHGVLHLGRYCVQERNCGRSQQRTEISSKSKLNQSTSAFFHEKVAIY